MSDSDERRVIRFDELNLFGKAVFLTGAAVRTTATALDKVLDKAVDVYLEAEDAFKQGLDPNVEDAKILGEWEEQTRGPKRDDHRRPTAD